MKAARWLVLCVPLVAHAPDLLAYPAHAPPVPATALVETGCELRVDLRGGLATVEMRQGLANPSTTPLGASYELTLPVGAALTGAAVGDAAAVGVASGFATTIARLGDAIGPDPLLVTAIAPAPDTDRPRVRATLQPIAPGATTTLTTRWTAAVAIERGALHLVIPGRGEGAATCHGTVRAAAGPGARVTRVRPGAELVLAEHDAVVDAELAFARPEPLVWTQRDDLGGGWAGELVTVLAPPTVVSAPVTRRAMFVIDDSRSMAMVGPGAIGKVVDAVAAALPPGTELDAILYDRTAARVVGRWQPADRAVGAITAAVAARAPGNGTDLAAALRLAGDALADGAVAGAGAAVIVITDGVLGPLPEAALVDALAANPSSVDGPGSSPAGSAAEGRRGSIAVHVIALDPGRTRAPGQALLGRPVAVSGGSYVEVAVDELDAALVGADAWVRPAWSGVAVRGAPASARSEIPESLLAGGGGTARFVTHGAAPAIALTGRGDAGPLRIAGAAVAGGGGLGALAASDATMDAAARTRALVAHPIVDDDHALAVLAPAGTLARDRRALVAAGGPYTRIAAAADPAWRVAADHPRAAAPAPSAIDRLTLERLFRDQLQPAAYVCYERALGATPTLAGTARFELHLARGEVTAVAVTGIADDAFAACLVDAAYRMTPPLPDLRVNSDDQTVAHYPLTFGLADRHPTVVLGDADSSAPLDIDAIQGGVPTPGHAHVRVDSASPLGAMTPD